MDYLVRGDAESLNKLLPLVVEICSGRGVKIGKIKLALIAGELVKRAREDGLMMELRTENIREFLAKMEGVGVDEG